MNLEDSVRLDGLINRLQVGEEITRLLANGMKQSLKVTRDLSPSGFQALLEEHASGRLTEARLWSNAITETTRPPLPTMKPIELNIKLAVDGNQWCALIGDNLQIGIAGFGDTRLGALLNLFDNYQKEHPGWVCKDCGKETRTFWPDKHRGDIGRCNECHFKQLAIDFPPPPLDKMETVKASVGENFYNYKQWPHNYIPPLCPYCDEGINRVFIGSYNDHVLHEHYCPICKVYFGQTD